MNNIKFEMNAKFNVSLDVIKKQVEAGQTDIAIQSLERLHKYCGLVKKHEEVIRCSYAHTPEVVEGSKKELSRILGSVEYPHERNL